MSIFDDFAAKIHAEFDEATAWTEKELHDLGDILLAGIKQFATAFGPAVLAAAQAIVPVLAEYATGMSGSDKAKIAAATIGNTLAQQGIKVGVDVGTSMINSAIEHVYASLPKAAPVALPAEIVAAQQNG